jgi:hypothetical protein
MYLNFMFTTQANLTKKPSMYLLSLIRIFKNAKFKSEYNFSHDDVGWIIPIDSYYVQQVRYILDSCIQNLLDNPGIYISKKNSSLTPKNENSHMSKLAISNVGGKKFQNLEKNRFALSFKTANSNSI